MTAELTESESGEAPQSQDGVIKAGGPTPPAAPEGPPAAAEAPPAAAEAPPPSPLAAPRARSRRRPRASTAGPRSVKLAAPPHFRLLDLGALADDLVVTTGNDRQLQTTYFDTPDLRLVRWGATLRHRAGEGWLLRLPDPDRGGHAPEHEPHGHELRFDGPPTAVPPEAVRALTAYVRSARLVPVARLRTVRRVITVLTHEGLPLAEIDDDEVSVLDGRRVAARFREVEVELRPGAPAPLLDAILERLHAAGAGVIDPTPKLVHALGARALEPPEVEVADLPERPTAADVVRRALASSVTRLLRHDAGVRRGGDPEDVHQARVATRRLRSDLQTFSGLLEEDFVADLRGELKWVADELGTVRDTEVLLERLGASADRLPPEDRAAGHRLLAGLEAQLVSGRAELLASIAAPRYLRLLDRLVAAAQRPAFLPGAHAPAGQVLPGLIDKPWRQIRRAVAALGDEPEDEALHDIRIRAKRLRYAAEAAAAASGKRMAALGAAAAGLQSVLGEFHDAIVADEWLRAHAGRGAAAFAAGQLSAAERAAAERQRTSWQPAWKQLRRAAARAWS